MLMTALITITPILFCYSQAIVNTNDAHGIQGKILPAPILNYTLILVEETIVDKIATCLIHEALWTKSKFFGFNVV